LLRLLRDRHAEVFDLNQKLVANAEKPSIIYTPHRYAVSAFQTTDRIRFNELRLQAEKRGTALRQRIDFARRARIQDLEERKRDLEKQLKEARSSEQRQRAEVKRLVRESETVGVSVLVRSPVLSVEGRINGAVESAAAEAHREAERLRRSLSAALGCEVNVAPVDVLLAGPVVPDLALLRESHDAAAKRISAVLEEALGLVSKDRVEKELQGVLASLLSGKGNDALPDLSRFPRVTETDRRLAYLGLVLHDGKPTLPVLYDLDEQGPRHTAVVGGSGSGKSQAAALIVEGAALHRIPVLVFDPTRAWTGLALPCEAEGMLSRYPGFRMERTWRRGFEVRIIDGSDPPRSEGIGILCPTGLTAGEESGVVGDLLRDLYEGMKAWPESKRLKLLLVFEEAHRYLKDKALQPILELFARTARAKGVGLLVVSQVAVDLPPAVRNNCATKIQLQTNYNQDLLRAAQVYGSQIRNAIPGLKQGQGALHFPEHGTCLVSFRPRLSSPSPLSEEAARLLMLGGEVGRAATLLRHDATRDTTKPVAGRKRPEGAGDGP